MTRITLCSAKGSPGVTTLACVLGAVWPAERDVLVAECDPSGGDLAGRFGLSTRIGMTSLVLTGRQGMGQAPDLKPHLQQLPGGLDVLVAPTGAGSATTLDHELGSSAPDLISGECDVLADCGRLMPGATGQAKMIRTADDILLLVQPTVTGIAHARWATATIGELSRSSASVVIAGAGVFSPAEVAEALGTYVLGIVPTDPRAALIAGGAPGTAKEFIRSDLVAFAREVVAVLMERTTVMTPPGHDKGRRSPMRRERAGRHRLLQRPTMVPRSPGPGRGRTPPDPAPLTDHGF
jgi:MinD-like ATPase involved in chromosome partitioning or flagellar assembly